MIEQDRIGQDHQGYDIKGQKYYSPGLNRTGHNPTVHESPMSRVLMMETCERATEQIQNMGPLCCGSKSKKFINSC